MTEAVTTAVSIKTLTDPSRIRTKSSNLPRAVTNPDALQELLYTTPNCRLNPIQQFQMLSSAHPRSYAAPSLKGLKNAVASVATGSPSVPSPATASFHVTRTAPCAPCHRARIIAAGRGEAWHGWVQLIARSG